MNMLQRARRLLTEPNDYRPSGTEPRPVSEGNLVRLLKLPPLPAPDYSDVTTIFTNAAEENAAMITPETSVAERLKTGLIENRDSIQTMKSDIENERAKAQTEHDAQIARLEDEMASRKAAHEDALKDFADRTADVDRALAAIEASIASLEPTAKPAPTIPTAGK